MEQLTLDELRTKLLRQLDEAYLELRLTVASPNYLGDVIHGVKYVMPQSEVAGVMNVTQKIVHLNELAQASIQP